MRPTIGSLYDGVNFPLTSPCVFAFDPGKSTGWAIWSLDPLTPWLSSGQDESAEVVAGFRHVLLLMNPDAVRASETVIENFIVPGRPQSKNEEIAMTFETIGQLKLVLEMHEMRPPRMQLPVERTITSRKLMTAWGWTSAGRPRVSGRDQLSAVQHLGSYLLQKNVVPRLPDVVR